MVSASRVGQLDANLLDAELARMFSSKQKEAFANWNPGLAERFGPEAALLLNALLFKFTIANNGKSYGAHLQNLVLCRSKDNKPIGRREKALLGVCTVLLPYLLSRAGSLVAKLRTCKLFNYLSTINLPDWFDLQILSNVWGAANLANLVLFVYNGKYFSPAMRLLGIKYAMKGNPVRNVNYEFQNRQLIWNALFEFLLFLLPLVNVRKLTRALLRPWRRRNPLVEGCKSLPQYLCPICFVRNQPAQITNPCTGGNCEHAYCYVCIARKLAEEPGWRCLRCGVPQVEVQSAT